MAWTGAPVPTSARARAREATAEELHELRAEAVGPTIARLLERVAAALPTRFFAAPDDGEPLGFCALFEQGGVAQIEEVVTLERARRQGIATALMAAAIAAGADAELLFLTADADDWVVGWYERIGFEEIGRRVDFTRAYS